MKTTRQAKLWKNKIEFFNDGEIRTIKVFLRKGSKIDRFVEVISIVKDNLALHLSVKQDGTLDDDYFTITHFQSGLLVHTFNKREYECDYVSLNKHAKETWEDYYSEGSSIRKNIGLPEFGDVN